MKATVLKVEFDRYQAEAMDLVQPGNIVVLPWGRGSGKTFFTSVAIHKFALEHPGSGIGLVMPTLKQARAVFWPTLTEHAHELGGEVVAIHETNSTITYRNGSKLSTWGAENANRMRGKRFDLIAQDETDDIEPDIETAVISPCFSRSGMKSCWIKTGTPRRGRTGILYRDLQRAINKVCWAGTDRQRYFGFKLSAADSPQIPSQEWLENERQNIDPMIFAREYLCDFDSAEGLVYPQFKEDFHVREAHPNTQWTELLVGADWGFQDPTVFLVIGIAGNGRDAICHVIEEHCAVQKTPTYWIGVAREIQERYPTAKWHGDPSRADLIEELRHSANVSIVSADKHGSTKSIEDGALAVADRLNITAFPDGTKYARLFVSRTCKNTIKEFGLYRRKRDPQNQERVLDDIADRDNHSMDALRYAIFSRFGAPPGVRRELGPGFER